MCATEYDSYSAPKQNFELKTKNWITFSVKAERNIFDFIFNLWKIHEPIMVNQR